MSALPNSRERAIPRIAIVVSHPIQHFVPFYRALAASGQLSVRVIYAARIGLERYFDRDMNTEIEWKMDLLSGYEHVFLPEAGDIKTTSWRTVYNPSVSNELASTAPDVVLIYGYNYRTSQIALNWCRRTGTPAIMTSDSELKGERSPAVRFAKAIVVPWMLRRFSAFITVGDCNEDYFVHYGVPRERLFRSPFTIDEERYRKTRAQRDEIRAAVRARWGAHADETLVLTVGKVNARKRTADLVQAAAACKRNRPDLKLGFVLAGNGVDLEALQTQARAEALPLRFLGFVNVDTLNEVYAACDVIAHPSGMDPHPLVMSEAACIGMPLVVSNRIGAVGPTDIAREGDNALVFPVGDVKRLAELLCELAEDPTRITSMSERSRAIFDELDIRRSVQGLVDAVSYCGENASIRRSR